MGIKHTKVSNVPDNANTDLVHPSDWNSDHTIDGDVDFNGHSITNCPSITGAGANAFTELTDVPATYSGAAGKFVTVGGAEDQLEFTTPSIVAGATLDWINVQDYGAVGDNSTNDTAAIQLAVDAAFGSYASPHGDANYVLNRPLYFPHGRYKITAPIQLSRKIQGGRIFGAGRFATSIRQDTANTAVFVTDGMSYSEIAFMELLGNSGGSGVLFDLDWLGPGTTGGSGHQSNHFHDMQFSSGGIGLRIGNSGYMGSENLIQECFFGGQTTNGIKTCNFDALQNAVISCNLAGIGGNAIYCFRGSIPLIASVGFQVNTGYEIATDNSAHDCQVVIGCRTESDFFWRGGGSVNAHLIGCTQSPNTVGSVFADQEGCSLIIDSCQSVAGCVLKAGSSQLTIRNSAFGRPNLWVGSAGSDNAVLVLSESVVTSMDYGIELENIKIGATYNGGFPSGGAETPVYYHRTRIDAVGEHLYNVRHSYNATFDNTQNVGGVMTCSGDYHIVDTTGGASSNLDTINSAGQSGREALFMGQKITLRASNSSRTIVVKHNTGNISLAGGVDFSLDNVLDTITLVYDTDLAKWLEVSRSDNGA